MHERRHRQAVSRALLSALVLRVCDEPPGLLLLGSEGAGIRTGSDGAAGEVEERVAEHERRCVRIVSRALLPAPALFDSPTVLSDLLDHHVPPRRH